MRIDHLAMYVNDLEGMRSFYERYFGAVSNTKYHNPQTGLETYFLSFTDGARLEIMRRPDVIPQNRPDGRTGYIHLAIALGSKDEVDRLTRQLEADGYPVHSGPRTTGDGYYESVVEDPEGNRIELTV